MDPIIVVLSVLAVILLVVYKIRKYFSLWKDMGAPYEKPHIFYGNLKGVGTTESVIGRLQNIYEKHKDNAPFVGIFVFFKPAALIIDLDLVKSIMIKDFNYFHDRGSYFNEKDDPLSAHMFNIYGAKWRMLRTKLSPTFTSGKMKYMFPMLVEVSKRLGEKIHELSEVGDEIDIKQLMARYTTDVIGTVAFGIDCNSLKEQDNTFHEMGLKIFDKPRHSFPMQLLLLSFREWALKLGIKRFHDEIHSFFMNVVRSTVDYRISEKVRRNDFMDILIEMFQSAGENKLTFDELAAQAFVFFAAGFETSSSLLQFCLYELACHPEIQRKARDHIEEVLSKHKGEFTYEAMLDMKYIDQVLNETLRMYPPLAILFRETDRDYKVPGTNYFFKKGTLAVISAYAIQRDERIFPNPEEFNPENFSEENMRNRPSVAHLPFGDGPRNCIGARFGMMQARVGLVAALRSYQYDLSPKLERPLKISPINFITTIVGGVWLKVKQIK
ncbi:unnamed protein product [Hermetia illucens]|uniref:Cytochrome P450 n=1 Tax=Hermetia illucens TaxID=343691 RepID=A0A7R8UNL1_HERIL|nr:probable cytochrome P450 6a14 [Hermetia illucens]CAD7084132.1 unnamed protein product [Hermetia illucens]